MANLKKNVASQNITFGLVSATDGSAKTGATVVVYITKDNGTQGTGGGTVTECGNGQYNYAPSQAETNATDVGLLFTASGAIPVNYDFHTDIVDSNGYPGVNVVDVAGTAQTARDIGASVLLSAGSGTGQLDFTSGVVKANLAQILGTALTETAGQLAAGFKKFFNVASPTSTMNEITLVDTITTYTGDTPQTGDSFARIGVAGVGLTNLGDTRIAHLDADVSSRLAPAGTLATVTNLTNAPTNGDLTATMKTSVTTAVNAATTVGVTSNRKKGSGASFEFLMQDATTGAPKTGLTVASTISKDGGSPASTSNSVTEIGLGQYQIILTGTEMTANNIFLQFTATGAVTANLSVQSQP